MNASCNSDSIPNRNTEPPDLTQCKLRQICQLPQPATDPRWSVPKCQQPHGRRICESPPACTNEAVDQCCEGALGLMMASVVVLAIVLWAAPAAAGAVSWFCRGMLWFFYRIE